MPNNKSIRVQDLALDLGNFRIMQQVDETHIAQAMISSRPDYFFALMDSLADDGYLPTENIIVLKTEETLVVKEGNRRVAALKLIHGYLTSDDIPDSITTKIAKLDSTWKADNESVPCAIYEEKDAAIVDRIITLAHGKGVKAGRDQWNAVARARHNRDVNKISEPALDLLEKYLKQGRNRTPQQAMRWAGEYPLTVLDEAIKRISTRLGASNAPDLVNRYPSIKYRDALEAIMKDIGLESLKFPGIRKTDTDFAAEYGVPLATASGDSASTSGGSSQPSGSQGAQGGTASGNTQAGTGATTAASKTAAIAIQNPRAVKATLKKFKPLGNNRQKVVTLRDEAFSLDLKKNPIAFCFLIRSMFEISAKAYCDDHKASGGPSATKADGSDRKLVDVLRDVTNHMVNPAGQKPDQAMLKILHGAMTELAQQDGLLSVTSMNQLVHNPTFSVTAGDISTIFGRIFPLLEAMNQ